MGLGRALYRLTPAPIGREQHQMQKPSKMLVGAPEKVI